MEYLRRLAEQINLQVEEALVELIFSYPDLKRELGSGGRVVVVGTDKDFSLVEGITERCPAAEVVVVERDPRRKAGAEVRGIAFMEREVGVDELGMDGSASLVVAKNLLHLVPDKRRVLEGMAEMVREGGSMVLSVPSIFEKKVIGEIESFGWEIQMGEVGKRLSKSSVWKLTREEE